MVGHVLCCLADDKKEQTFIAQLVTKITDNLQFSIENIHIRYEDRSSDPTVSKSYCPAANLIVRSFSRGLAVDF